MILLDDLNTPGFIAKIHELYNEAAKGNEETKLNLIKLVSSLVCLI